MFTLIIIPTLCLPLLEIQQNEFLRFITNSKTSTPPATPMYMLQAELGCLPVDIKIKTRMIGFWLKIVNSKDTKLRFYTSFFLLNLKMVLININGSNVLKTF